ncbi:MAG: recombinase family protein [Synergistaceae bacterium]|nr:recombinase family protein [Synergistaceae bacterium]
MKPTVRGLEREKKMKQPMTGAAGRLSTIEQTDSPKLRVAAYIRVSTTLDIQENSFEVQERYYTDLIRSNPDWRMAGIYADNGVSGTCKERRTGFQRLMRHCEEGKIDRVLCKSLSRFARNTLDTLDAVRRLKDLGIPVFFEKENLDSLSVQSEFVLSTIAAIAQEESRSISENTRVAYKHRSAAGQLPMVRILGYRVSRAGKHGPPTVAIDPDEAKTVRFIYRSYINGARFTDIANDLIDQGWRNVHGEIVWSGAMVRAVLLNEKYTGDYRSQKTYTADYLTHRVKKNRGEVEQHVIKNHHEAIIDRKTWNEAQLLTFHPHAWRSTGNTYPFTGRLHCTCGANYQRSNSQSRFRWMCGKRKMSRKLCDAEGVFEDVLVESLKPAFLARFGKLGQLDIKALLTGLKTVQDFDNVERRRVMLKRQIATVSSNSAREELEARLASQEHLWNLQEQDRSWRAEAIEWLKGMEDRRADTAQLMNALDAALLRAWFLDGTIDGDRLTVLWLDGNQDEVRLEGNRKKPARKADRKGENEL